MRPAIPRSEARCGAISRRRASIRSGCSPPRRPATAYLHVARSDTFAPQHWVLGLAASPTAADADVAELLAAAVDHVAGARRWRGRALARSTRHPPTTPPLPHKGSSRSATCTRCACHSPSPRPRSFPRLGHPAHLRTRARRGRLAHREQRRLREPPRPGRLGAGHARTPDGRALVRPEPLPARGGRRRARRLRLAQGARTRGPRPAHRRDLRDRRGSRASGPRTGSGARRRRAGARRGPGITTGMLFVAAENAPRSRSTARSASPCTAPTAPTARGRARDDATRYGASHADIDEIVAGLGEPAYRATQVWEGLWTQRRPLEYLTNLSKTLASGSRPRSRSHSRARSSRRRPRHDAQVAVADDRRRAQAQVETVLMRYPRPRDGVRLVAGRLRDGLSRSARRARPGSNATSTRARSSSRSCAPRTGRPSASATSSSWVWASRSPTSTP